MSCTRAKNVQASSSFDLYMHEIQDRSRLTPIEEKNLAVAIAGGDKDGALTADSSKSAVGRQNRAIFLGEGTGFR